MLFVGCGGCSLAWRLFHEIVVLNPESKSVHADRNEEHDNCKLQFRVVRDPPHEELSDHHDGVTQYILDGEQHRFHAHNDGVPDDELNQPSHVVDSAISQLLHNFGASFSDLQRHHLGIWVKQDISMRYETFVDLNNLVVVS